MTEKNYKKYSLNDFLEDREFISWVLYGRVTADDWDSFLERYPKKAKDFNRAIEIVSSFREIESNLPEEEVYRLWKQIDLFDSEYNTKKRRLSVYLRYAAIAIIFVSIGYSVSWLLQERNPSTFDLSQVDMTQYTGNESQLILADGRSVELADNSTIEYDQTGDEIVVDSDSIITQRDDKEQISETVASISMNQVMIPKGKFSKVTLTDGTKVWLNSGSRLIYPARFANNREVFLIGEGYFDVTKNSEFPFIVRTAEVNVKVLGTKFSVIAYPEEETVETVLVEGKVEFSENEELAILSDPVILSPNQRAIYSKRTTETIIDRVDVELYTSWINGMFKFEGEKLEVVIRKISDFYGVDYYLDPALINEHKISGKLDLKDTLNDVLLVISEMAPIKYRVEENKVKVFNKN
ncbi:FecR family protein [Puteibacter caeruleilacunae]|nr:FecR family protein [Puteibacter caeruleilacunae]